MSATRASLFRRCGDHVDWFLVTFWALVAAYLLLPLIPVGMALGKRRYLIAFIAAVVVYGGPILGVALYKFEPAMEMANAIPMFLIFVGVFAATFIVSCITAAAVENKRSSVREAA